MTWVDADDLAQERALAALLGQAQEREGPAAKREAPQKGDDDSQPPSRIAQAVLAEMTRRGLTPASLARLAGVPADGVERLVGGKGSSLKTLEPVLAALDLIVVPSPTPDSEAEKRLAKILDDDLTPFVDKRTRFRMLCEALNREKVEVVQKKAAEHFGISEATASRWRRFHKPGAAYVGRQSRRGRAESRRSRGNH